MISSNAIRYIVLMKRFTLSSAFSITKLNFDINFVYREYILMALAFLCDFLLLSHHYYYNLRNGYGIITVVLSLFGYLRVDYFD